MQKFLIPLFVCLVIGMPSVLLAQMPQQVSLPPGPIKYPDNPAPAHPDMMCNNAGTFTMTQFIGHSNDHNLPKVFLCDKDSFLIQHNGDAVLTGDPDATTPPGVAFAFYKCLPTIMGDNFQSISLVPGPGDPCLWDTPFPANGMYLTEGVPNGGNLWFYNNGGIISGLGMNQPTSVYFAALTVDEIIPPAGFESATVGAPPGPCVNVNTADAFQVIYLNPITAQGIDNSYGNDCLGKFTARGGYPEYDNTAVYDINIYLTSDPNVKAIIHTQSTQLFHLAPVIFSVPQAGNYTIEIKDGKACPATFTMDMNVCDASDNITLHFPDTIAVPNATNFCIPVTVDNFDIVSGSFSINWDPTVLQYVGINHENSVLDPFSSATLNDQEAINGNVGLLLYDQGQLGNVLSIPDGDTLFQICFNAIAPLGACTGLTVSNNPTAVGFEDATGQPLALTVDTGRVCINFPPLGFTVAIFDTTCLGTASMRVTATGGMSPFSVTVHEFCPAPGPTYSGNISGIGSSYSVLNTIGNFNNVTSCYAVCVTDSNGIGQTICDTINVMIPTLGSQISFIQQPTCNGLDDGLIQAVVLVGGSAVANPGPQYTFSWSPNTVPNPSGIIQDGTVSGHVPAGNYSLIVTDTVRHCSAPIASGTLGQPAIIKKNMVTATNATCTGVSDGMINYTVQGGTPFPGNQFQFAWENTTTGQAVGSPGQNNPIVLNSLAAGTYQVTLTDMNGCTAVDSVVLTDARIVNLTENIVSSVTCHGLSDGGAAVSVSGVNPPGNSYTFTWVPATGTINSNPTISALTNAPAGDYFVTAQDGFGCKDTLTVTILEPAELKIDTIGVQGPGCGQQNSGTINVTAQGGTGGPNYTYNWDIPAMGPLQNGLGVGTYTCTVTDQNGCKDSISVTLNPPTPPALSVTSTPVKCGSDGSLIAVAPTAVSYAWTSLPAGTPAGSNDTISNLMGGTYAVMVTDGHSCVNFDTVTLASVTPLSFQDTTFVEPHCYGTTDGTIGIVVQDGQAPYTNYTWNPAQPVNGPTIFSIAAGNYCVTVTDNVGCTLTGCFTLNQPPQIKNAISGLQDVSCFGVCDGSATVMTNYATTPPTAGNFIYIWSDGMSTSAMRTDLCAGMQIVTAADPNNCSATDTIMIGSPTQVTAAESNATDATCFGNSDGTATIHGGGGNGAPYSVLWSTGATGDMITGLTAGPYTATVTDANGCTGVVNSIVVGQPAQITVTQNLLESENPICFGDANGMLSVDVTGGNQGNLNYVWTDEMGNNLNTNNHLIEDIPSGAYSVVVTDAEGCTGSLDMITLQDPPPVLGSYQDPAALVCNGDETTLRIDTIFGGTGGPYSFSLDYGAVLNPGFPVSLSGGEHYITYYDAHNCSYTDTINLLEPAPIEVTFSKPIDEIELGDTTYQLKPLITGATVASFNWTPAEFLHTPDTLNPYVYAYTSQTYTLTVFDDKGCSGTGSVTINVDPNRNVYLPNVFRPGVGRLDDHFNVFLGRGIEIVNYMRVYDRWGELMYSREHFLPDNDNFGDGWDGRFNGHYVDPGVFVYIVEVKFLDGRVLLYRGDVTVVR